MLATLNIRSQCYRLTKLVPPGPAPPERRPATSITVSSVMSTGTISGGQSRYVSRLAADGKLASGCLVHSTPITFSPVLVQCSSGCSKPPFPSLLSTAPQCQIPLENQDVVSLRPVLLGLLSMDSGKVLCAGAHSILHQHPMSTCFQGVDTPLDPPLYCVGCSDMSSSL